MHLINRLLERRHTIRKRASGYFHDRLDGAGDILGRADQASVLDVGCNCGLVSLQLVNAGATLVHGCDLNEEGLATARQVYAEWPVTSRFERVDLTQGAKALSAAFGSDYRTRYDIVLYLAVHQKLKRVMPADDLAGLTAHLVDRARYFVWRGFPDHLPEIQAAADVGGLMLVQYSAISQAMRAHIAVWRRPKLLERAPMSAVPVHIFDSEARSDFAPSEARLDAPDVSA